MFLVPMNRPTKKSPDTVERRQSQATKRIDQRTMPKEKVAVSGWKRLERGDRRGLRTDVSKDSTRVVIVGICEKRNATLGRRLHIVVHCSIGTSSKPEPSYSLLHTS